jgi:hypothetical protein
MKRLALLLFAGLGLMLCTNRADAGWHQLKYSGYQPWWNIFAKRYKGLSPEEARLQKFWHDYYNAMKNYYAALDNIDWVAYYKNHGYQINGSGGYGGGCGRINYAPVFVSPSIQWAIPNSCITGPQAGMGGMGMPYGSLPMGGMPGYPHGH